MLTDLAILTFLQQIPFYLLNLFFYRDLVFFVLAFALKVKLHTFTLLLLTLSSEMVLW